MRICYSTRMGSAYQADCQDFLKELKDEHIDLLLTSPPFALTRKKEYGNENEAKYVDWFMSFADDIKRVLSPTGSLVLDLGGAYIKGRPVRSIYMFDLLVRLVREQGFHLCQEFYHYNPSRLPAPAQWVNVERCRVKDSVNVVWWLSKTERPKANNRNVLKPYSKAMQKALKDGYSKGERPSGHVISEHFAKDNGGAIPPNLLELPNTDSNSRYFKACKKFGVKPHPARFPTGFAEFFIKFLTDEGDTVLDIFAGSNTTGFVAEGLNRYWTACDISEEYVRVSQYRFDVYYDKLRVNKD